MATNEQIELAWAAGFFDGEGTTSGLIYMNPQSRHFTLSVAQVELQPLERFRKAVGGMGTIYWRERIHCYAINGADAKHALDLLWPYMSEPKRKQATQAMLRVALVHIKKPNPNDVQDCCLRGHKFSEVGVYVDKRGRRECAACRTERRKGKLPPIQPRVILPAYLPMREYDPVDGERAWSPT